MWLFLNCEWDWVRRTRTLWVKPTLSPYQLWAQTLICWNSSLSLQDSVAYEEFTELWPCYFAASYALGQLISKQHESTSLSLLLTMVVMSHALAAVTSPHWWTMTWNCEPKPLLSYVAFHEGILSFCHCNRNVTRTPAIGHLTTYKSLTVCLAWHKNLAVSSASIIQ